ncbi:DUF4232 domain-containing protein [Saccharopolyspora sp. TS4A08]|uniref:DUF4232 domain-containing protein n=1 Tax=Saccharopolyspora ipomoeae TaxID=3042027 RepID=A0ABT6PHW7_9PSEU|nr:DUF4232 domain-containing protein [Saccharopolyspora sp. TS4A08]MDI2027435.1 DUF4232 domain-containing protein [Saccharopolyspora sp. TS4A08]
MTRTRIIVAATAALLIAGLSACDEDGSAGASGTVINDAAPETTQARTEPAPTEETGPDQAESGGTGSGEQGSGEATTSPDGSAPDEEPSSQVCKVADLAVTVQYVDSAAGTVHQALRFTNTGNRTCEIQGFPGVSYVGGDDGHQIGKPAGRSGDKGPAITLDPGSQAWAPLAAPRPENYDEATCRPQEARGFRVYPPQEYDSVFVPLPLTACSNTEAVGNFLTVRTLQEGSPS